MTGQLGEKVTSQSASGSRGCGDNNDDIDMHCHKKLRPVMTMLSGIEQLALLRGALSFLNQCPFGNKSFCLTTQHSLGRY